VARDNEQPILAVDAPARPRVADEWVAYPSSRQHRQLLLRVLRAVLKQWDGQVVVPAAADAVIERMFDLPAGSGRAIRGGFPCWMASNASRSGVKSWRKPTAEATGGAVETSATS
jgi:hypothetical protein